MAMPFRKQEPVPTPAPKKPSRALTTLEKFDIMFRSSELAGFSLQPNRRDGTKQIVLQIGQKTKFFGPTLEEVIDIAFDKVQPKCPKCGSQTYLVQYGKHNGTTFKPHSCNDCTPDEKVEAEKAADTVEEKIEAVKDEPPQTS